MYDVDKDQKLTEQEFLKVGEIVAKFYKFDYEKDKYVSWFKELDHDGDFHLNKEEYIEGLLGQIMLGAILTPYD